MTLPYAGAPGDRSPLWALKVWRCPSGESHCVRLLAYSDLGLLTHFVRGKSVYCPGEGCLPALHRTQTLWKGYNPAELYVQAVKRWAPIVLEVSEHLETKLRGLAARGQVWELSRLPDAGKKKAPIDGTLLETLDPALVPPAFDVLPNCRMLYHSSEIRLDVKNPMPARQIVTYSDGPPPPSPTVIDSETREAAQATMQAELAKRRTAGWFARNGAKETSNS